VDFISSGCARGSRRPARGGWPGRGDSAGATCHAGYRANAWCADFAAWVWRQAGVPFTYGYAAGDINAGAVSFYNWGQANGTWHPLSSAYNPQPGDAAVYGNSSSNRHVGIYVSGSRTAPTVINGNWAMNSAWTLWGVVNQANEASDGEAGGGLQGYVSPVGSAASAPSAPTSVSATPWDQGYATVSWQPGSDGGSAITAYAVTSNPPAVSLSYSPSYTSVTLNGLTTGVSYTFTVTATNGVGTSAPSAPSNAITPYTYPGPPAITRVVAGDGQATVSFSPPANDGYTPHHVIPGHLRALRPCQQPGHPADRIRVQQPGHPDGAGQRGELLVLGPGAQRGRDQRVLQRGRRHAGRARQGAR
jgi:hypothetical protein